MSSYIEVKKLLLKIGTKEKSIDPVKYFLDMILSMFLFAFIFAAYIFMLKAGVVLNWLDFIFIFTISFMIVMPFYIYGLFRYCIFKNK